MQPRLRRTSRQAVREWVIGFWKREECAGLPAQGDEHEQAL